MRAFLAVWPDDAVAAQLALLRPALSLPQAGDMRVVQPASWHVTLRFLGDLTDDMTKALAEDLDDLGSRIRPGIRCVIGPETRWLPGNRVLVLPVNGLDALASHVDAAVDHVTSGTRDHPFTGHLTLARRRGPRRGLRTAPAAEPAPTAFAKTFVVSSFDLVASELGASGPRYTIIRRVMLRAHEAG